MIFILHVVFVLAVFAAGVGVGRIKNKAKLAAIDAATDKALAPIDNAVKTAVKDVKSKL